jgi:tRNA dimethylallyltransferase
LVAIVGPTAAGKSALALRVAETFSGEIVNCDSLQLYRGFDIGTAKTPAGERRGVPHHLFDVLEANTVYSAGDYARAARAVVAAIAARELLPVVAGGTGFYLRALLDGLPALPARDEALRRRLAAREHRRPGSLHRLLSRLEPGAAARIHARDTQKLIRALEVRLLTRARLPDPAEAHPLEGFRALQIGLAPDRKLLTQAIARRTQAMFQAGLVEEVRALLAHGLTGEEKPFESLGYKQAVQYIRGTLSWEDAIESTEIETRQYAKRQLTWFRRDPRVHWIEGFGGDPRTVEQAFRLVRAHLARSTGEDPRS